MKNSLINLSLLLLLASSQSAFSELPETPSSIDANIETIVVVAKPEVANFEIFSERRTEHAVNQMMSSVIASLDNNGAEKASNTHEASSPI